MKLKQTLAAWTVLLFMLSAVAYVYASSTVQHPQLKVFGDVQKDCYVGRSIFEYRDDQGLSSVLPFSRQDKDITINFANIVFSNALENKSISAGTTSVSSEVTLTKDVLIENGVEYIYMKISNSSVLTANTAYSGEVSLSINDKTVTNDYYLMVTAYVSKTGANLAQWKAYILFYFKDTGATDRILSVAIQGQSGTDTISSGLYGSITEVGYVSYGNDATWKTVQIKIQDMLDEVSASYKLSKLYKIVYKVGLKTGATVDGSSVAEIKIRHALVNPSKVYIDDGSANGLAVNGTSGTIPYSVGDVINVYGANATKIVGVTVPWQVEVEPEIQTDADNLRMQYTWEWTMPKSPSGTGDTLTFSNTNITLYGYKDGAAWDKLYVNGVDKLSSIATKTVPTSGTVNYWTYGLASSLVQGNMYQIVARIQYTAEEFDALTEAPLFWSNPLAWIQYKFWSVIIAVAAFLGLSTAWATKQRRKVKAPKVK